MAEPHRIHPVDVEAAAPPRPSAPLVPRDAVKSEKGDPAERPQLQRTIPVKYMPPPRRRRSCCLRCFCWSICFVVALLVAIAITAAALYLIYQPKSPNYSVDKLTILNLQLSTTTSGSQEVSASFRVTVTATNPNKAIGIYYVDGSHLSASYRGYKLCEGQLPVFYQGHRNTTVFDVTLDGRIQVDEQAVTALQEAQAAGSVPLVFDGKVPVKVKFGALKLWKVKFLVTCDLVASNLAVGKSVSIRSSSCSFKFRL